MRDEEKRELATQRQKSGGEGDQPVFDNIIDDKVHWYSLQKYPQKSHTY